MLNDPVADMLTRIRNANLALHDTCDIPASKLKRQIARVLEEQGYIEGFEEVEAPVGTSIRIRLKYDDRRRRVITGLERVSKPGRRVYVDKSAIPRILGGMGIAIVSTSHGVLTGHQARERGVGGEVMCAVW